MKLSYIVLPLIMLVVLGGCEFVHRQSDGAIVGGIQLGVLADTANQAAIQLAGQIPVIGGSIQTLLMGLAAGGMSIGGLAKGVQRSVERRRKKADISREIAERELAVVEALLEAKDMETPTDVS